jgi:hypothetical protein
VQPRLQLSLLAPYARHGAGGSGATAALVRPCDYPGCHMLWFHQDDAAADAGAERSEGDDDAQPVEDEKVQEVDKDSTGEGVSRSEHKVSHLCLLLLQGSLMLPAKHAVAASVVALNM